MTTLPVPGTKYRIESIDLLRGLIMLLMAIDHTRDFFHAGSPNPSNYATTTPFLFFTRWITHFCAALFVFLSGVSVNLSAARRTKKELSLFLVKRALWLIVVEFVLITFAITFDPSYHILIFQVIWVIALSLIILSLLIWLPLWVTAVIGGILFFGHDLLSYVTLPAEGPANFFMKMFFTALAFFYQLDKTHSILVLYAVLPWTGVLLMGYVLGQIYRPVFEAAKRKKILAASGITLLVLFFVLRTFNIYGDPRPWEVQATTALSIISYFNLSKYPPSLLFLCMTIGPGLLLLSVVEGARSSFARLLIIYGNVPFFYYILHFYLLRLLNIGLFYIQGYSSEDIVTPRSLMLFRPVEFGVNLLGVYIVWILVITILYFPCRWFSNYKKTHHHWWLSYI